MPALPARRRPILSRVRRDGRFFAVEVAVEPVELPVEALDEVFGFASARQVVVLAGEDDELGRRAEVTECTEPLLALFERDAVDRESTRLNSSHEWVSR